ncbi:MAG: hypothetical protein ACFFEF_06690 [Candidatus Thorarchaeota archaeon]
MYDVQIKNTHSVKKETQHIFLFKLRIKALVILALVMTLSSVILVLSSVTNVSLPSGNSTGSRTDVIAGDTYLRISVGTSNDEWLLLSMATNVSSDIYVRGTEEGDMRFYDTSFALVKCGNWFIVTVFPSDACLVQFEWRSYNLTQQFDITSLYVSQPLFLLILFTIAFDTIAVLIVLRSRLEIID